ncbi:hypothetical protein PVAND_012470 [Polypedilum vanderplanki]|uniref:MOSC domain-containing protein n=1 Tax=Polypedilum vanderplanki TaxID=319348 RepID=A0A9J6CMI2_POLVA|nr:hypothetical protein PVAND_012470 [Polypedilum vanderplanki]
MSRLIEILEHPHTKIAIASLAAVAVVGGVVYYMKKNELLFFKQRPKNWIKVGNLANDLWIFPIKSCGGIPLKEIDCNMLGPHKGRFLRDRVFMVVRSSNNEFTTARTYPKMILIKPTIENNIMSLNAPGMDEIKIDIDKLYESKNKLIATVWKDKAPVVDCGDEVAKWFSQYISDKKDGFRLVFYPSNEPKPEITKRVKMFKAAERKDTGSLQDETSYMMMNMASFDDLNTKLEQPVGSLQFRPNFVVTGTREQLKPWDEDNWKFVKIGNDAVFQKVEPCLRCYMTIIDPETGERNKKEEPLKTLKSFRIFKNINKQSPLFGIHLGLKSTGTIRSGDAVYVSY